MSLDLKILVIIREAASALIDIQVHAPALLGDLDRIIALEAGP